MEKEFSEAGRHRWADRCRAIMLRSGGYGLAETSMIVRRPVSTIKDWNRQFRKTGMQSLRPKTATRGRKMKLGTHERRLLAKALTRGPRAAGYNGGVWTSKMIAKYIEKRWGVEYHPGHVRKLLYQLGFSVQFPREKLALADEEAQERWLKETYPEIKKNAKLTGATILFEDEVYFQQEGTTRRSWAKRGIGFTVYRHPCKRKSIFYGAISIEEEPVFVFQKAEWFNAKTFRRYLRHLLSFFNKVCLILDNVSYHKAEALQPFLEANHDRLWLHYLPPYSPDLNAVETVWRETRKDATHNSYFPTTKGLTRTVQTQFKIYQNEPSILAGLVNRFL